MPTKDTAGHTAPAAVTILMPAFNAGPYIDQAIGSALAQTRTDFELLVVDDGSTDDTAAIAARYAEGDPRIRLIRQSNQGIGSARNTALREAAAPWVALLDSDDVWFPTYLAEQLAILERQPEIDVLSANAVNMGGIWDGQVYNPRVTGPEPIEVSLLDLVRDEDAVCILSIVRRRMLAELGAFNTELRGSEDYDLWLRGLLHGYRIFFNPTPLGGYRRRPDSVSADEIRMLDAIVVPLQGIRSHPAVDPGVRAVIEQQLRRFTTRRQVVLARQAMASGEIGPLVERLEMLHHDTGQLRYRVAAALCRLAPRLFIGACRARTAWRAMRTSWSRPAADGAPRYDARALAQATTARRRELDRVS